MKTVPNINRLLPVWNFKKLRNKAWRKRNKEIVAFHEAGHVLIMENFNIKCDGEIHEENGKWCGSCSFDDNVPHEQKIALALGGLFGETSYIIMCQKGARPNDDRLIFDPFDYFLENKIGNYSTDLTFFVEPNELFYAWKTIMDSNPNAERLIDIAMMFFNTHSYNP